MQTGSAGRCCGRGSGVSSLRNKNSVTETLYTGAEERSRRFQTQERDGAPILSWGTDVSC